MAQLAKAVVAFVLLAGVPAKGIPGAKAPKGGWDGWVSRGEAIEKQRRVSGPPVS